MYIETENNFKIAGKKGKKHKCSKNLLQNFELVNERKKNEENQIISIKII